MTTELGKIIGSNLRQHRDALGLSQDAMAERLGYHRTYLGALERGERNLTLASVEELARRLDSRPLDLLTD